MAWTIHHGDCREVMAKLDAESVDAVICDPPYGLSFMGKEWDSFKEGDIAMRRNPQMDAVNTGASRQGGRQRACADYQKRQARDMLAFQEAMNAVFLEALRVAKPGAHLLAFGGTRTYHRLACAIEDAGWEIRDCVMWVYGSGFPKSHDVSKAIDKAAGAEREVVGSKLGQPGYSLTDGKGGLYGGGFGANGTGDGECRITAPATAAARQWSGWGTALKPAWEPIIVARKPLASAGVNVLNVIESQLRERGVTGDIRWKPESASDAGRKKSRTCSSSTDQPQTAGTSAASAGETATQNAGRRTRKSSRMRWTGGTPPTQAGNENFHGGTTDACVNASSPLTVESVSAAEKASTASLLSTTSTAAEHNTESNATEKSTPTFAATDSRPDTESFVGIATGLTGSMATVRISRDSGGMFLWPMGLPEFVRGSPLTVAENVLRHGTGAINVDGCRIGTNGEKLSCSTADPYHGADGSQRTWNKTSTRGIEREQHTQGRWPANVIHDGSDEVVGLFPANVKGGTWNRTSGARHFNNNGDPTGYETSGSDASTGSAARFFYCAKASKADRDEGCEGLAAKASPKTNEGLGRECSLQTRLEHSGDMHPRLRNHHPTVKPTALMRYLCRLVTPPGGVVLDPFTGSGSTGKAAVLEGFNFVGIEREAEYVEIAKARVAAADGGAGPLFA